MNKNNRVVLLFILFSFSNITLAKNIGVWWDYSQIDKINAEAEISLLKKFKITRVHIEISEPIFNMKIYEECKKDNPSNFKNCAAEKYTFGFDKWPSTKTNKENLGNFIDKLNKEKISVVLMIWPIPSKKYISSLYRLAEFSNRHSISAIELEAEENWDLDFSTGDYKNLESPSNEIFTYIRSSFPSETKIAVTTAPRNFKVKAFDKDIYLFKNADIVSYQSYQNIFNDDGTSFKKQNLSKDYAVGKMQQQAIETFNKIKGMKTKLILGLPAYHQSTPLMSGEISMYITAKAFICDSNYSSDTFYGANYWSWKNIKLKKNEGSYAKRFLLGCSFEKIALTCKNPNPPQKEELAETCPSLFDY